MCNRAQSSPRIWAMAMGNTTERICYSLWGGMVYPTLQSLRP